MKKRYRAVIYLTQTANQMTQIYYSADFACRWLAIVWCFIKYHPLNDLVSERLADVEIEITDLKQS